MEQTIVWVVLEGYGRRPEVRAIGMTQDQAIGYAERLRERGYEAFAKSVRVPALATTADVIEAVMAVYR